MTISVGYAQNVITPGLDRPVYLAGFGHDRRAKSVHDDLYARALAVSDGERNLAMVAVDLIGLGRANYLEIRRKLVARMPGADLLITSTHTHHGPDTIGLWGPNLFSSGVDPLYMDKLCEQIQRAATAALQSMQPALLRAAAARVSGVVKNARDPEILDDELVCVQWVRRENRQPLVTLINFACHPETLWKENPAITSDYPHRLREYVENETRAPCLFISGALGGMQTPDVEEHSFAGAERNGQRLGKAALSALATSPTVDFDRFDFRRREFDTPLKSLLLEQAMRVGLVKGSLIRKEGGEHRIRTETSLLRLGPAWFAAVPGELLPKLGLRFKSQMHQHGAETAGIIGLANDEIGYILPDEEYVYPKNPFEPGEHYEETMSVGPTTGSCLARAFEELL